MLIEKQCTKCKKTKTLDNFNRRSHNKEKFHSWCKACNAENSRKWAKENPVLNRIRTNRARRKYRYGLEHEDYLQMLEDQNRKCFVCNEEKKLHIDHCHKTGKVRSLLCYNCNIALGHVFDSKEKLKALIKYLELHDVGD